MRGYGNSPGSEVMGIGDWLNVSQSVGAIGATIDRKRQEQRQNTLEDQDRLKEEQSAQAFNYFLDNPEAMDFDNPEKQTAKPSAIGEVAGIPKERPRLPIEDYSPEAIAKARVAAMSYWTNKKSLSAESLRQTAEKAKLDKQEFIKGISLAATSLANGDEEGARGAFVDAYNEFYPDAHKMRVNEAGEFIMSSPTGAERNLGKPNMEQMIDEFLGSPAINEKAFAQMSLMNKRAIQEMNRQSLEKPQPLYSKSDGKEYFAYAQIDPETKDRTVIVTTLPAGMPGSRTLTAEEITGLGLHTEDAVKFKEDRQKHGSDMATDQAQRDYYNDRGSAAVTKAGGSGKMTQEEKASAALDKEARQMLKEEFQKAMDSYEFETPEDAKEYAIEIVNHLYPNWTPDWDGGAIDQAKWEQYQEVKSGEAEEPQPAATSAIGQIGGGGEDKEAIFQQAFEEKYRETNDRAKSMEYAKKIAGIK